jgi:lysophospholipase L1-like esterase
MSEAQAKSRLGRWMQAHPRKSLLVFNLAGVLLVLLVVEGILRNMGMQPGYLDMGHGDFRPLPKGTPLRVEHTFFTDSTATFRAFPDSFNHKPGFFINEDGFRTRPFGEKDSSRKRIMFIGDSFVWGATAKPIDSSFVDLVGRAGYETINLGIPGTGPPQYARLAEKYIPQLEPDQVVVVFYLANDILYAEEDFGPGQNPYYITNAGWLNAFLDDSWLPDADSAYAYYLRRFGIPRTTVFNRFCAATVIGSRAWQLLRSLGWVEGWDPEVKRRMELRDKRLSPAPVSERYLQRIANLCRDRGIPFHLLIVPLHTDLATPVATAYPDLFVELPYREPGSIVRSDYNEWPDGHFNNHGHRKFADFVLEVIGE